MKVSIRHPTAVYRQARLEALEKSSDRMRTIVIFGAPRGGTTMVAGVVQRCGIDLGSGLPNNLEDQSFVQKPVDEIISTIQRRNAEGKTWGWKHPIAVRYLPKVKRELINPCYIIVWRDPFAISTRVARAGEKIPDAIEIALRIQEQNLKFMRQTVAPFLMVSYEKAIGDPVTFAREVAEFVGGHMPADLDELMEFTRPGSYKKAKEIGAIAGMMPSNRSQDGKVR